MDNDKKNTAYPLELSTIPEFAGSPAYYLRYEDPHNSERLVGKVANEYWRNVNLYIGGTNGIDGNTTTDCGVILFLRQRCNC
jgi:leucyl-tRNA synthetase